MPLDDLSARTESRGADPGATGDSKQTHRQVEAESNARGRDVPAPKIQRGPDPNPTAHLSRRSRSR